MGLEGLNRGEAISVSVEGFKPKFVTVVTTALPTSPLEGFLEIGAADEMRSLHRYEGAVSGRI
jgi:hypothetical protein